MAAHLSPHSPTFRHNPFNGDSDTNTTNTSADVTPVHLASRYDPAMGDEMENGGNVLEVIRYGCYSFAFWFQADVFPIRTLLFYYILCLSLVKSITIWPKILLI